MAKKVGTYVGKKESIGRQVGMQVITVVMEIEPKDIIDRKPGKYNVALGILYKRGGETYFTN